MRRLNKINKKILFTLILFISIGFAYLTRDLTLSGISSIFRNTWDVHFDNIVVSDGSVEAETPVIDTDRTSVSFTVEFSTPGDFYEFTVDAVNGGTIDAMLNTFTSSELDESVANLLEYTVTYADGEELAQYQELNAGDSLTYKIRLYYKLDIQEEDLPDTNVPVEITFTTDYIQADSNRIKRLAELHSLYNVLKNEAESGGDAFKYSLSHKDSMDTSLSTEDIYYYHVNYNSQGYRILNKNNVIFANHCWQMIRTTDTGGVKMIYNGEVENNKCLGSRKKHFGYDSHLVSSMISNYWYGTDYSFDSDTNLFSISGTTEQVNWNSTTGPDLVGKYTCKNINVNGTCSQLYLVESFIDSTTANLIRINIGSHFSQFGRLDYNRNNDSPAYVGYMYGDVYKSESIPNTLSTSFILTESISSNNESVFFGNSISDNNNGTYTINNPVLVSLNDWSSVYSSYNNKYTCNGNIITCTNPRYVTSTTSSNYSFVNSGEKIVVAKNRNGLELLDTLMVRKDEIIINPNYYIDYKYTCDTTNSTCNESNLKMITQYTNTGYIYVPNHYYGNSVTWDGYNYTLNNTIEIEDYNNIDVLNAHHYMCVSNGLKTCESVAYIYYYTGSGSFYYITLKNGVTTATEALESMLSNNTNSSLIKFGIEAWYKKYLFDEYDEYIEDTIFCNRKSVFSFGGWGNYGTLNQELTFDGNNASISLDCKNVESNQFSVSNTVAKLNYKVGLMSLFELNFLGSNTALATGKDYLIDAPKTFNSNGSTNFYVYSSNGSGVFAYDSVSSPFGVRPSISLRSGILYSDGDGSRESPYIVYTN